MRVIVDAMCADFGGIRTYVEHLLGHWSARYPDDDLHVAVRAGSSLDSASHVRHEIRVRRPGTVGRPAAQSLAMHRLIDRLRPDAVLATMPNTTIRRFDPPLAVVVHDLRHELRPEQFTAARRLLRRFSYGRSYQLADGFIAVSARTLEDLHNLHPQTRGKPSVVVHHGADHVLGWAQANRLGPAIAFAHHTNKNPDLIVDGWQELCRRGAAVPPLTILGVPASMRDPLEADIAARSLTEYITLAPFLPDEEFRRVMASADMIVFPSEFEGFGLPVVEGMTLGKPVVIGPEKATNEIAGGHAVVMSDWDASSLADAVVVAETKSDADLDDARSWAQRFTWDATVDQTRSALRRLVGHVA